MFKTFARAFGEYREFNKWVIVSQVCLLFAAVGQVVVAAFNQRIFDDGVAKGDTGVVIQFGLWMLLIAVVAASFQIANAYLAVFFAQGTAWVLRTKLYRKIGTLSFENLDRFRTSGLLVRLNADVENVMWATMFATMLLMYAVFMLIAAMIMTAITALSLIWLLIVVAVIVGIVMGLISPLLDRAYRKRQEALDGVNDRMQENLAGIRVVKAFVREDLEKQRFADAAEIMRSPAFKAAFWMAALTPILTVVTQLATVFAVWVGGVQILDGSLEFGSLVAFIQYLVLVITPLALLAIVTPWILRGRTSMNRIVEVMDADPAIQDKPDAEPIEPAGVDGGVRFENVTFAFRRPDGELDPPVLRDIDLEIAPGERVGFLGATGAGKTALINLIPRFYDTTEGRVLVDGVDVRELPKENLREIVGVALQEAVMFQGDVRFNLKFGNPDTDDESMVAASKAADAFEFIDTLPERWEAPVARRGYNFSGGQRQRLNIGRSLTAEPRVLVLDDSTSAVDVSTEARIQEAIPELTQGITTLYVAQRISAVIDLDKIVLLADGRIEDMGTHEDLLERSELYQEIYESQLGAGVRAGTGDGEDSGGGEPK